MSNSIRLAHVLAPGKSLQKFAAEGLLDRDLTLVREYQKRGIQVTIVSFGGRAEYDFSSRLPGLEILCNWMGLPDKVYARRIHQVHALQLLKADVVQTAEASAIIAALRIAWAWQTPLIYRWDYILSDTRRRTHPEDTGFIKHFEGRERQGLTMAAHVTPATQALADVIIQRMPAAAAKLTILPNFVNTAVFRPMPEEKRFDLVYIGRLSYVKNVDALLEAVKRLGLTIAIVGGPLPHEIGSKYNETENLKNKFGDLDGRIHWLGRIDNEELPVIINQAKCFVLSSLSEGHPRALIEAMACGLPVIGTDVFGIQDVLQHEVTGYLCDTDTDSIASAIKTVLAQPSSMEKMGANARNYTLDNYSLDQVAQRGCDLLQEVARRNPLDSAPKRVAHYLLRRRS